MLTRKEINKVFTPRSSKVNVDMYIPRKELEELLARSIDGTMHTFLFGESGNGKSWLYKKVLSEEKVPFVVANCANASRKGSIVDEIFSVCMRAGSSVKMGYTEEKKASLSMIATAELSHADNYEVLHEDRLLQAFKEFGSKDGSKSVIVLDNLETIMGNGKLMGELSDIIILLDDERYADYGIKFLIVGLPNEVVEYFSAAKNPASVANRVEELYRVCGLDASQVRDLVKHGFTRHLKIEMTSGQVKTLSKHIDNITLGVPQRIHEYCEGLAHNIKANDWRYSNDLLEKSDHQWLIKGLRECYNVIDGHLNADETVAGRRNQVIYALGKNSLHQVQTNKIGNTIAAEFPETKPASNSGIGQVLAHLTKGANPVLKKVPKSSAYVFTDPRYLMCIRMMLDKNNDTEQVCKKGFKFN